jgi:hypothetical protein
MVFTFEKKGSAGPLPPPAPGRSRWEETVASGGHPELGDFFSAAKCDVTDVSLNSDAQEKIIGSGPTTFSMNESKLADRR